MLAEQGYRAIAPDLRGFGDSSKPQAVADYELMKIVTDVSTLMRRLDVPRAHVVGHDWGAATAWLLAALMPARVDHLAVISVGHPLLFRTPDLKQRERSWYVLLYQFEGVAEALLQRDGWALFREMFAESPELPTYIQQLSKPGALTAQLNWYRANWSPAAELEPAPRIPIITKPTLAMWGAHDPAISEERVAGSSSHVSGYWRYERIDDAAHCVPLESPELVSKLLVDFLGSQRSEVSRGPGRRRF